jgi:hypothetical protein
LAVDNSPIQTHANFLGAAVLVENAGRLSLGDGHSVAE